MAESDNFTSEFSRAMDCHICMDRLDDPKVLSCQHSFCKSCLDNLILFQGDGSGIILCPLGCNRSSTTSSITSTLIPADKTTNDLPVPYQLKAILDAFNKQTVKHDSPIKRLRCRGKHECAYEAIVYCLICKMVLCAKCFRNHDPTHTNVSIQYDRQAEQIRVVCGKHRTMANYFCCDEMICVYCKNRDHILHKGSETIKEQANKVKESLVHPEYGVNYLHDLIVNTLKNAEATQLSISVTRSMLQKTLRNRKLKGLHEYLSLVQKEERRIMDEYDDIVNEQLQLYPKPVSTDFYNDILVKEDFEIIFNKIDLAAFTKTIPLLNINLSESSTSRPLGDLDVKSDDFESICDRHTGPSVSHSSTGFNLNATETKHLKKLKCLLNDITETIEEICGPQMQHEKVQEDMNPVIYNQNSASFSASSNWSLPFSLPGCQDKSEPTISIVKTASVDPAFEPTSSPIEIEMLESVMSELNRGRSIDCIRDLCKDNNEDLILSVLELRPSVISTKNKMGNTPFHFAASFGCARVLSHLLSMDGNNIDTPNSLGSTPLHYATENRHANCVEMLLSSNCGTDLENISGYTALSLAHKLNYTEIITLFQKYVTN